MVFEKRILAAFILLCFLIISQNSYAQDAYYFYDDNDGKRAYDYKLWQREGKFEQKVFEVGYRLLNSNRLQQRVAFRVMTKKNFVNAFAILPSSHVIIFKNMFSYIDNDDELAALLGHEIRHIQQFDSFKIFALNRLDIFNIASKYYEHDADIKGVDLMVKAGYNPLAMISFQNKTLGEQHWLLRGFDYMFGFLSHPTGSKRLMKVYNHIKENYPEYIEQGYDNIYYVNFLINSDIQDENVEKLKEKYNLRGKIAL